MKIVYYGYRDWSINIFSKINMSVKYLVTTNDYSILDYINPDLIFFIGWSSIVPNDIIENYTCICLHPSDLPKYRGGSPIQNQIIDGIEDSKVSFFIMDEGVDTGDILYQPYLSLRGKLSNIFSDIEKIGTEYINRIIDDYKNNILNSYKQDESKSSFCKRRKESDSEIKIDDILNNDPVYLYNKIRSLNDPYPNAFIRCKNGKKLFLIESKYEK
jgi:methionyl-tRNA formyltransferase